MTMVLPSQTERAVVARVAARIRGCPLPPLPPTQRLVALSLNRDLETRLGRLTETVAGTWLKTQPRRRLCDPREVELAAQKKTQGP
jgi:hypothetical protein